MSGNNTIYLQSRKKQRKEARSNKRQKRHHVTAAAPEAVPEIQHEPVVLKPRATKEKSVKPENSTVPLVKKSTKKDKYSGIDPELAEALRRDDEEIAELEAKLGLASNKKGKKLLHQEYAKQECYGEDFGDFLDELDALSELIVKNDRSARSTSDKYERILKVPSDVEEEEESCSDEDDQRAPLKMSHSTIPDEKEDSESEASVSNDSQSDSHDSDDESENSASDPEQMSDEDHHDENSTEASDDPNEISAHKERDAPGKEHDNSDRPVESESDVDEEEHVYHDDDLNVGDEPDHDREYTYRPKRGEDIYGKPLTSEPPTASTKYIPPHMRQTDMSDNHQESVRAIQRILNGTLNRLSDDTLLSVSQSMAQLYSSHSTTIVNDCIWKSMRSACFSSTHVMTGLIPVYVAAMAGVHYEKGDTAQLGEFLIEMTVTELVKQLEVNRKSESKHDEETSEAIEKTASNMTMVLCYLYNYGIVHCFLLYDIIRNLIESFKEVDVELLLLILCHSGRSLRSDDPRALKEIVLLVQKQYMERKDTTTNSSRMEYMVSALTDLKNNKRRKQDSGFDDRTSRIRKILGTIKSRIAEKQGSGKSSDASLRIGLQDIVNVETKGRWWKIGASWVGNQYKYQDGTDGGEADTKKKSIIDEDLQDEKLLKLAAAYRMNTDTRRSIFCIIMSSADCEDAFEKLVRASMLKSGTERDSVRVILECCGNEKAYNKYYSHLAARICGYQPLSKFTFQLAFFDAFKQFEEMTDRKAANLAKLMFHLIVVHRCLKLNVLKAIDMSSPEDLPENAVIFLTIFFSTTLEYFQDPSDVKRFFESCISHKKPKNDVEDSEDMGFGDESEALRANLSVFFLQVLKASPKYKKGSKFRANLKAAIKACDPDNFLL
jgi:nucleolar MIF4G domain-containing protein 1